MYLSIQVSTDLRPGQVRLGQVRLGQVRLGQVRLGGVAKKCQNSYIVDIYLIFILVPVVMSPILLVIPDRRLLYPLAARSLSVALLHPIHLRQQQTCHSISNFKINTNPLLLQWLPHSIIRFLPLIIQGTVHHFYISKKYFSGIFYLIKIFSIIKIFKIPLIFFYINNILKLLKIGKKN